jgi:hypothetical protein
MRGRLTTDDNVEGRFPFFGGLFRKRWWGSTFDGRESLRWDIF